MKVKVFNAGFDLESDIKKVLDDGYILVRELFLKGDEDCYNRLLCVFRVKLENDLEGDL